MLIFGTLMHIAIANNVLMIFLKIDLIQPIYRVLNIDPFSVNSNEKLKKSAIFITDQISIIFGVLMLITMRNKL